ITIIGGAAVAWPLAARAQQPAKLPTIGFLGATTPVTWSLFVAAFVQRLRELGWIEGRTIAIEYRLAEGRGERFAGIAAEVVRLHLTGIPRRRPIASACKGLSCRRGPRPRLRVMLVCPDGAGPSTRNVSPGGARPNPRPPLPRMPHHG